jgi:hypothetical protein
MKTHFSFYSRKLGKRWRNGGWTSLSRRGGSDTNHPRYSTTVLDPIRPRVSQHGWSLKHWQLMTAHQHLFLCSWPYLFDITRGRDFRRLPMGGNSLTTWHTHWIMYSSRHAEICFCGFPPIQTRIHLFTKMIDSSLGASFKPRQQPCSLVAANITNRIGSDCRDPQSSEYCDC